MDISVEITNTFKKDLVKFSVIERSKVKEKLNYFIEEARVNKVERQLYKPGITIKRLPNNFNSSLYVFRVNREIRIILTFEEDPLFNQTVLTLYRIVNFRNLKNSFKSVAESLYQNMSIT